MFAEILVLVSCWKKTYANHMLYRNISWNVFHFWDFWGFLPLLDSTVEIDRKLADRQRKWGGVGSHATKASGWLKPWTLQLEEMHLLTKGARTGRHRRKCLKLFVSRHEHHLLSSHLSPLPTLRFDCTVHKLLCCCCFFLVKFYSWSNQLKKKSRMKF